MCVYMQAILGTRKGSWHFFTRLAKVWVRLFTLDNGLQHTDYSMSVKRCTSTRQRVGQDLRSSCIILRISPRRTGGTEAEVADCLSSVANPCSWSGTQASGLEPTFGCCTLCSWISSDMIVSSPLSE